MSFLSAGASTQSRANRPLPDGWQPLVVNRHGVEEIWLLEWAVTHKIHCTWVFDQGGPVLGYDAVAPSIGLYGPGSVVSFQEEMAAKLLAETVGPFLATSDNTVRFFANGSDACDAAVRLARYATGRDRFLSVGYHGSSVIFGHAPQNGGIPDAYTKLRFDMEFGKDAGYLREAFHDGGLPACLIVEVPSDDETAREYLAVCRRLCDATGALLVLDELVTGFRLSIGGAAEYYGVRPDLACYGKAMSNGRGIAALVGNREIVSALADRVFFSNTLNGDPYNCAHVIATLNELGRNGGSIYPHIWGIGETLRTEMARVGIDIAGHAPRTYIKMPEEARRRFCAAMVAEGIVMDRPNYSCWAHTERHVALTRQAAERVLA